MFCSNCGKIIPDGSKFCPECGMVVTQRTAEKNVGESAAKSVTCPSCGATVPVGEAIGHVKCSFCGTEIMLNDEATRADRLMKVRSEAEKRDLQSKAEYEKQIQSIKMEDEQRKADEEDGKAFRKSKLRKLLIVFAVISLLFGFSCVGDKNVFSGMIAFIQAGCYAGAWLCGMQYVRPKVRRLHTLLLVIGLILIIPFLVLIDTKIKPDLKWPDSELAARLPRPSAAKGETIIDNASDLTIDIYKFSKDDYDKYAKECENKGFTVEETNDGNSYDAYDSDGYHLSLSYYDTGKQMNIDIEAPEEMAKFEWPTGKAGKMIPHTKSDIGNILWENDTGFAVKVGKTTMDDYNNYVKACSDSGFTVNYSKSDKMYYADNADGYHLTLSYEGFDIIEVKIDAPSASSKSEETDSTLSSAGAQSETTGGSSEAGSKDNTDSGSVTPEFKEAMDSYEAFFDEYVELMNKVSKGDSSIKVMTEYYDYLGKYQDTMDKLDAIDESKLSPADDAYYVEVMARIEKKLIGVAGSQ